MVDTWTCMMRHCFRHAIRFSCWLVLPVVIASTAAASDTPPTADFDRGDQLVVVIPADWQQPTATMTRFEKRWFGWRQIGTAVPVVIGKNGSGWGLGLHTDPADNNPIKQEGDGRAPAGLFDIGIAFGAAEALTTRLDYIAMDQDDWCIDVPASPLYNRIVDRKDVGDAAIAGSTEPMRRDIHSGDDLYHTGFVIEHNRTATANGGSCIFAHRWRGPDRATAGCTAMAPSDLDTLLAWLDTSRHPRFLLLPETEYRRRRGDWSLPRNPR